MRSTELRLGVEAAAACGFRPDMTENEIIEKAQSVC